MKKNLILKFLLLFAFLPVRSVLGAEYLLVTPAVIDLKGEIRDISEKTITLKNISDHKVNIYPVVQNIDVAKGKEEFLDPSRANLEDSSANWISFPRGRIELMPGEEKSITFTILINLTAKIGEYHAAISFPEGPNRDAAEAGIRNAPYVIVNTEVFENLKGGLEIMGFKTKRIWITTNPTFEIKVKNIGEKIETISGKIYFYNSNGNELGAIELSEKPTLSPGETKEVSASWSHSKIGRRKAFLNIKYGPNESLSIQDTIFFYLIPWPKLLLLVVLISLIFAVSLYRLAHKDHKESDQRHTKLDQQPPIPRPAPSTGKKPQENEEIVENINHIVDLRRSNLPQSSNSNEE